MEMSSKGYSELRFNATLDYGNTDIELHVQDDINVEGGGGYWDVAYWDEFQWDSQIVGNPSLTLEGDGPNISLSIYSKTDEDLGHTMEGVILHYTPLRIVR